MLSGEGQAVWGATILGVFIVLENSVWVIPLVKGLCPRDAGNWAGWTYGLTQDMALLTFSGCRPGGSVWLAVLCTGARAGVCFSVTGKASALPGGEMAGPEAAAVPRVLVQGVQLGSLRAGAESPGLVLGSVPQGGSFQSGGPFGDALPQHLAARSGAVPKGLCCHGKHPGLRAVQGRRPFCLGCGTGHKEVLSAAAGVW